MEEREGPVRKTEKKGCMRVGRSMGKDWLMAKSKSNDSRLALSISGCALPHSYPFFFFLCGGCTRVANQPHTDRNARVYPIEMHRNFHYA